jgi:hypothetical protein
MVSFGVPIDCQYQETHQGRHYQRLQEADLGSCSTTMTALNCLIFRQTQENKRKVRVAYILCELYTLDSGVNMRMIYAEASE